MKIPPVATYRLQFRNGMTFDRAVEIVPYLKRLGISHLYASPIFAAVSDSTHGYDVVDHNRIDSVIGGEAGFRRLHAALRDAGMGLILDIVPNHMAASLENPWWRSVVEHGGASPFAQHFDIDWREKLTLPILGRPYDDALRAGELAIAADADNGSIALAYFDNRLPLHPPSYRMIAERLAGDGRGLADLADLAAARDSDFPNAVRGFLASEDGARFSEALSHLSNDLGFIERLHAAQPWQLTFWKDARRHLSYRRFFEVTGLVGVRVEEEAVFDDVHRLILSLVRSGMVDGLRVDHVDGLACPTRYLERLRAEAGPDVWILVEKILEESEQLPPRWDCATTGYEFIPALADLLVDAEGQQVLEHTYGRFIGEPVDAHAALRDAKLLMLRRNFEGELTKLVELAERAAADAGLSRGELEDAIVEIAIGFEVYRTYGAEGPLCDQDQDVLARAVGSAQVEGAAKAEALELVAGLLRQDDMETGGGFRIRFQQLTGPVMAKAVEDTLFYRHNPMISLNEVGASPGAAKGSLERFHAFQKTRAGRPPGLLATATHDTKRGEDARARLHALSERPAAWVTAVERWHELNRRFQRQLDGRMVPEPAVEWLLYQALAGCWPFTNVATPEGLAQLAERFLPYVEKALREAKGPTDWLSVNEPYEEAVRAFASHLLEPGNGAFLEDFARTMRPFAEAGAINGLSQTLAKLTVPGIPDIYQGAEALDLSLVDPDNRRAVDFGQLADRLARALEGDMPQVASEAAALLDGRFKQWMIARCLHERARNEALFSEGMYEPLAVSGAGSTRFAAFLRRHGDAAAIVVLPRLTLSAAETATESVIELPAEGLRGMFRNVFTSRRFELSPRLAVTRLLDGLPMALAVTQES